MNILTVLLAVIAFTATPVAAPAQDSTPAIKVEQPWARASAGPAKNGIVYLTLKNTGTGADRLVAGTSPVAGRVEFHIHIDDLGVMRMRKVDAIDVKPGKPMVFKPGGLHVMLIDLDKPLKEGERFPLTLTFERTGNVTVDVAVHKAGARGPRHDHGRHGGGS